MDRNLIMNIFGLSVAAVGFYLCLHWFDYKLLLVISLILLANNVCINSSQKHEMKKNNHITELKDRYIKYLEDKLKNN